MKQIIYYECRRNRHSKFYEVSERPFLWMDKQVVLWMVYSRHGIIGREGVRNWRGYLDKEQAQKRLKQILQKRIQHGYERRLAPSIEQHSLFVFLE